MARAYADINLNSLIYPYFVTGKRTGKRPIKSFPGVYRYSIDELLVDIGKIRSLGIDKVLLFGISDKKDDSGIEAFKDGNVVSLAVEAIKAKFADLTVMTDVCLCAYTNHGHCHLLEKGRIKADSRITLEALVRIALSHARAGADWVAPSAMARKQVKVIRAALDKNGFKATKILGYSAKFASNFYGPFRNAADSYPAFGDRSGYQLDYRNTKRALSEIRDDIDEGADMVMVKPALSYLDIIKEAKLRFDYPLAAYNVSGEYAFVKYGSRRGLWDEKKMVAEIVSSIKRAGCDFLITYHAKDIAQWQRQIH